MCVKIVKDKNIPLVNHAMREKNDVRQHVYYAYPKKKIFWLVWLFSRTHIHLVTFIVGPCVELVWWCGPDISLSISLRLLLNPAWNGWGKTFFLISAFYFIRFYLCKCVFICLCSVVPNLKALRICVIICISCVDVIHLT